MNPNNYSEIWQKLQEAGIQRPLILGDAWLVPAHWLFLGDELANQLWIALEEPVVVIRSVQSLSAPLSPQNPYLEQSMSWAKSWLPKSVQRWWIGAQWREWQTYADSLTAMRRRQHQTFVALHTALLQTRHLMEVQREKIRLLLEDRSAETILQEWLTFWQARTLMMKQTLQRCEALLEQSNQILQTLHMWQGILDMHKAWLDNRDGIDHRCLVNAADHCSSFYERTNTYSLSSHPLSST